MYAFVLAGLMLVGLPATHAEERQFFNERPGTHEQFVPRAAVNEPRRGNLRLTSVLAAGGEAFPGTHFTVLREQPDAYGKTRATVMAIAGPKAFADIDITPDRYRVQARNGSVTVEREIQVPDQGGLDAEIVLDAGEVQLRAAMDASGSEAEQAWFRIYRPDTDSYGRPHLVQVASDGYAASGTFVLPAGEYVAEARYGDATVRREFALTAGSRHSVELPLNAGHVAVSATFGDSGEAAEGVRFEILRATGDPSAPWAVAASSDAAADVTFVLPAGHYRARAVLDRAEAQVDVTVNAGDEQAIELAIPAGELLVYATLAGREDALLDSWFGIVGDDANGDLPGVGELRGPDNLVSFILPAGEHRVLARHGESSGMATVTVEAGSRETLALDLDAGRISMTFSAGSPATVQPYTWFSVYRVERGGSGTERRHRVYNEGFYANTDIVLPTGRYIAFAKTDRYAGEQPFDVAAGSVSQITITATR
jgi:hypothetical protein